MFPRTQRLLYLSAEISIASRYSLRELMGKKHRLYSHAPILYHITTLYHIDLSHTVDKSHQLLLAR